MVFLIISRETLSAQSLCRVFLKMAQCSLKRFRLADDKLNCNQIGIIHACMELNTPHYGTELTVFMYKVDKKYKSFTSDCNKTSC